MSRNNNQDLPPEIVDLKQFRFFRRPGRPKKKSKAKYWTDLLVEVTWTEYDIDGNPIPKIIRYSEDDMWHTLQLEGKKVFTEKVFYILGDLLGTDPYFARELQERLEELYNISNNGKEK